MAGSVAEAHLDPKDYWFGTQVLEDNTAASVVADFSSIKDFDSRVKNYNVSYWRNAEEKLDMCPATLDPLGNNVFVARIDSEDGKKGYILKIEFDLVSGGRTLYNIRFANVAILIVIMISTSPSSS